MSSAVLSLLAATTAFVEDESRVAHTDGVPRTPSRVSSELRRPDPATVDSAIPSYRAEPNTFVQNQVQDLIISKPLAEWHGQVLSISDSVFIAELKGTHGIGVAGKLEEAVIPIEEVQPSDRELLRPGAFFRLCVSYESDSRGTRRRFTQVVFRRLPAYRREELEEAERAGRELARALRVE